MSTIRIVKSRDAILFSLDGKQTTIAKTHMNYDAILGFLEAGDIEAVKPLLVEVRQYIANSSDGLISYRDGKLYMGDKELHNALSKRIVSLIRDGRSVNPLVNFLRNLMDNPSYRAVNELYGFLEASNLPITADGYFLAYKVVKSNFFDKHTGTMDNSPGQSPSMERNEVDEDKNALCSKGLHFCSDGYRPHFGSRGGGDKCVVVRINPRDVVSIPTDYKNSKGRACLYTVLREIGWDETLPVDNVGFPMLADPKPDPVNDAADDAVNAALAAGKTVQALPGQKVYTDADIRAVKVLLAEQNPSLTDISKKTGMSRRQVARIRDGEIGGHVTL